jgi:hypothetical protein
LKERRAYPKCALAPLDIPETGELDVLSPHLLFSKLHLVLAELPRSERLIRCH